MDPEVVIIEQGGHRYKVVPITLPATTGAWKGYPFKGVLVGFGVRETTGTTAAEVDILDGTGGSGQLLVPVSLAGAESAREWLAPPPLPVTQGITANVTAGSVSGVFWVGFPVSEDGRQL